MKNKFLVTVVSFAMVLLSYSASSSAMEQQSILVEDPTYAGMVGDLLVARPLSLVAAVAGSALYVVSLPLSIAGGNHHQAANALVRTPMYHTFARCLGCTASAPLQKVEHHEAVYHDFDNEH